MAHTEDIDRWNLSRIGALGLREAVRRLLQSAITQQCRPRIFPVAEIISLNYKWQLEGECVQGKTDGKSNPGLLNPKRSMRIRVRVIRKIWYAYFHGGVVDLGLSGRKEIISQRPCSLKMNVFGWSKIRGSQRELVRPEEVFTLSLQ
jgi:hypothetical protein